ncbi:MAG: hypothetical protein KIT16_00285 [Rhodospirillaceae bacterium]|nr:hypothetical protein [Rhodospirillaceae bacterium]
MIEGIVGLDALEPVGLGHLAFDLRETQSATFAGGEPFRSFAAGLRLRSAAVPRAWPGLPLFFGADDDCVLGGYLYRCPGQIVLMPFPDSATEPDRAFIDRVERLVRALGRHGNAFALPAWAAALRLPEEDGLRDGLRALEREAARIAAAIGEQRRKLDDLDVAKALLAGSGPDIAQAALIVLRGFGASATAPDDAGIIAFDFGGKGYLIDIVDPAIARDPAHMAAAAHRHRARVDADPASPTGILLAAGGDLPLDARRDPDEISLALLARLGLAWIDAAAIATLVALPDAARRFGALLAPPRRG